MTWGRHLTAGTNALSLLDECMASTNIGWLGTLEVNSALYIGAWLATHHVATRVLVGFFAKHAQEANN